jgi:hypothetical protein
MPSCHALDLSSDSILSDCSNLCHCLFCDSFLLVPKCCLVPLFQLQIGLSGSQVEFSWQQYFGFSRVQTHGLDPPHVGHAVTRKAGKQLLGMIAATHSLRPADVGAPRVNDHCYGSSAGDS